MQNNSMPNTGVQQVFDQIFLVNVEYGLFGAYRRTTEDDLKKMNTSLPGGGVITKGAKKIFPCEPLQPFGNHKREISRKLASVGVSALGGVARAVPLKELDALETYLADAAIRFDGLKATFGANYDAELAKHIADIADPVVQAIVKEAAVTKVVALSKLRFKRDIFKLVPHDGDGQGLIDNLASKLYVEVAQTAKEAYDKSFLGRPRVGQKALHQVKAARNKLAGLSMLDNDNINILVDHIDKVLSSLPGQGWIEGAELASLTGLILTMSDADNLMVHIEKLSVKPQASAAVQTAAQGVPAVVEAKQELVDLSDMQKTEKDTKAVKRESIPSLSVDLFAEETLSTETELTAEISTNSILVADTEKTVEKAELEVEAGVVTAKNNKKAKATQATVFF